MLEEKTEYTPMPEAPASLNLRFSTQMGFEGLITLRSFSKEKGAKQLLDNLHRIEEELHTKGCRPIFGKNSAPAKTEPPDIPVEHWCEEHQCEFQKWNKEGRSWYSHQVEDTDEWCHESKKK
jgi:hypothetical protein